MEFFVEPGTQNQWMDYWTATRIAWYRKFANNKEAFRLRRHDQGELAHYSEDCYDVEYQYPWGWDELEGIASRTDYDLKRHSEASGAKLSYFDQNKADPETGKPGWRYIPYVVEPAAGLTRSVLCFLLDAYTEESGVDATGETKVRTVLKLNPMLSPIKAAILPLVKKDGMPERAQEIAGKMRALGLRVAVDTQQSIGKRYSRHDEVGTPFCMTIDNQTMTDGTVTMRDRDTTTQTRVTAATAIDQVLKALERH